MTTQLAPQLQTRIREWKPGETLDNLAPQDVVRFSFTDESLSNRYFEGIYKGRLENNRDHMVYSRSCFETQLEIWTIKQGSVVKEKDGLRFKFDHKYSILQYLSPSNDGVAFDCTNQQLREAGL